MQNRCLFAWALAIIALYAANRAIGHETSAVQRTYRWGAWQVLETPNFQVCCPPGCQDAKALAQECESLCKALRAKWLAEDDATWTPKCQVLLHGSLSGYLGAVGSEGRQTAGSSLVTMDKGRVLSRRIDLRGDKPDVLTAALPHELTHVVLADRFGDRAVPHWADEGMAILADPPDKRALHARDLHNSLHRQSAMSAVALLSLDGYPTKDQWGAFYGQSASLVEYLVSRESPATFVAFLEQAQKSGYDAALRETYGIENAGALDRLWRRQLHTVPASFPLRRG